LQIGGIRQQKLSQFECILVLPGGHTWAAKLAVLPSLDEPHGLLVGRDLLSTCRLPVNFKADSWALHLPACQA